MPYWDGFSGAYEPMIQGIEWRTIAVYIIRHGNAHYTSFMHGYWIHKGTQHAWMQLNLCSLCVYSSEVPYPGSFSLFSLLQCLRYDSFGSSVFLNDHSCYTAWNMASHQWLFDVFGMKSAVNWGIVCRTVAVYSETSPCGCLRWAVTYDIAVCRDGSKIFANTLYLPTKRPLLCATHNDQCKMSGEFGYI